MQVVEPLMGAIAAVVAALLGAFATYWLGRKRASDRSVLELWRAAFDRSAFKGPYTWHSDQKRFKEAIELTIQCVNTGVLQNRKGTVLGTAKAKAQIKSPEFRAVGDTVERKLNRIRQLIPESGSLPQDAKIIEAMDQERGQIVETLNAIWKKAGLPLLPSPADAATLDDVFHE